MTFLNPYPRPDGLPDDGYPFPSLDPAFVKEHFGAQLAEMRAKPSRQWEISERVLCTYLFIGLTQYLLDERAIAMAYFSAACAIPRDVLINIRYDKPIDSEAMRVFRKECELVVSTPSRISLREVNRLENTSVYLSNRIFKCLSYNGYSLSCDNVAVCARLCDYIDNQRANRPGPLFIPASQASMDCLTPPGITRVFRPIMKILDLPRVQFARLNRFICGNFAVYKIKNGARELL